ncbi:MAG: helix-turn-helix domain-containing protein [Pseudonocardiaceae bacterium]
MTLVESRMAVLARRVRELRKAAGGMTQAELGRRMTALGQQWGRTTVAKLETGNRESVTPDEWWALALVFEVPPPLLLVDPAAGTPVRIAEGIEVDPWTALLWMTGKKPLTDLPGQAWDSLGEGYEAAALVERFHERRHQRELAELEIPAESADDEVRRRRTADAADERFLRQLVECLKRLQQRELTLPPLPDDVVKRAAELGVNLPGGVG